MVTISDKLDLITEAWNDFFLEITYCQNQINFSDEVKTNYFGDIRFMFDDTIRTLNYVNYSLNFEKSVLQVFGILQVVYIQQDLIDELLYIFHLKESDKEDKNPNRIIRNELIGHPIRRDKNGNKLISSVIFGRNLSKDTIHYIVYSGKTNYAGVNFTYKISEILKIHDLYLHKYLDIILDKINRVLTQLKKKLECVQNMINKQVLENKIIRYVEQNFGNFTNSYKLYSQNFIDECILRVDEHPRYKNVLAICRRDLIVFVTDTIEAINELLKIDQKPKNLSNFLPPFTTHPVLKSGKKQGSSSYSYEFSKLYEIHPIFSINYFKSEFSNDEEILAELQHMESNIDKKLEYYSAIEYLKSLLVIRGLL